METDRLEAAARSPFGQRTSGNAQTRFLTVLIGALAVVTVGALYAPLTLQIAALGALLSFLAAWLVAKVDCHDERSRWSDALLAQVRVLVVLAADHHLFQEYEKFTSGLLDIARQRNPVFRDLARFRVSSICDEIGELAAGRAEFRSTETWRSAYQGVLEGLEVKTFTMPESEEEAGTVVSQMPGASADALPGTCLLYTSDAADERVRV